MNIQELVIDVLAVVTSSRHADRSSARRFDVDKPTFSGRTSFTMVLSKDCLGTGPVNPPSPVTRRSQNASLESPVMIQPGVSTAEMEGQHHCEKGYMISMYRISPIIFAA